MKLYWSKTRWNQTQREMKKKIQENVFVIEKEIVGNHGNCSNVDGGVGNGRDRDQHGRTGQ